jgi:hypothetical protein
MSSLVFLGFSVIIFVLSYGIMWLLAPTVLGALFSMLPVGDLNAEWLAVHVQTESVIQWLIPLIPTVGIFILVIKVMMVASVRGRD